MIRLPLVSRSRRSVLNNFNRLIMKDLKYPSSDVDDICASSCKSYLITSSEGSESVFKRAKKVPSSMAKIYASQLNHGRIVLQISFLQTFLGALE